MGERRLRKDVKHTLLRFSGAKGDLVKTMEKICLKPNELSERWSGIFAASPPCILKLLHYTLVVRLKPRASCVFQSENAISHTVVRKTNIFSLRYACDPWLKSHYECVASSGRNEETIRKFHIAVPKVSFDFHLNSVLVEVACAYIYIYIYMSPFHVHIPE